MLKDVSGVPRCDEGLLDSRLHGNDKRSRAHEVQGARMKKRCLPEYYPAYAGVRHDKYVSGFQPARLSRYDGDFYTLLFSRALWGKRRVRENFMNIFKIPLSPPLIKGD
jgi:hypothetical protein